ncbi:MAG: hypothetical protein K9I68_04375 [Bacteroidales bacterium]|nr:hypothetical protein [Bacteroidales bacterium]MCF8337603.1 hypothetical protein [Bacteroidales bacterium]
MNIRIIFFCVAIMMFASCEEEDFGEVQQSHETFLDGEGFFIVNEGNFSHSNSSVSFYSFDSSKVYNRLFYEANSRPLGDVSQSMIVRDTTAFIVVNNSSKIEQVSLDDFESKATYSGFTSPRHILPLGGDMAYVSDLYSDSLAIIDMKKQTVDDYLDIGRSSEAMVKTSGKVFAANWSQLNHPELPNNKIMVIDPAKHELVDSVEVTKEPNSMVVDSRGDVWVLCSGGYTNEATPALYCIDAADQSIKKHLRFKSKELNPSELSINESRDTLYYLNQGVYRMSTSGNTLPQKPFLAEGDKLFYALGIMNRHIAVSDAVDYQQKGIVYLYDKGKRRIDSVRAGIIPGFFIGK